jgi:hypothetical protein
VYTNKGGKAVSSKQILIQEIDALQLSEIDEVSTFVSFLKFKKKQSNATEQSQQTLWEEVKQLYGIVRSDIDEKAELAEARDEKYAHPN